MHERRPDGPNIIATTCDADRWCDIGQPMMPGNGHVNTTLRVSLSEQETRYKAGLSVHFATKNFQLPMHNGNCAPDQGQCTLYMVERTKPAHGRTWTI